MTLLRFLEETRGLTDIPRVLSHLEAAIAYTNQPRSGGSGYKAGRPLERHLRMAARAANLHRDWELAERLANFADYVVGKLPLNVLDMWYDPSARTRDEIYMRQLAGQGAKRASIMIRHMLRETPTTTAGDILAAFEGIALAPESVSLGETRTNGTRLKPKAIEHLVWLGKMELLISGQVGGFSSDSERLRKLLVAPGSPLLADLIQLHNRRVVLDELRAVVSDPASSEADLQACLQGHSWIFGGIYVKELATRQLTAKTIVDIPLLRGDGSLHVVELKRANIRALVRSKSGHLMPGADVHWAVCQVKNYLRTLDEHRDAILKTFGIDTRRASGTVVIGHPDFVPRHSRAEVDETLRTYGRPDGRIDVITYQTLIESTDRMLSLAARDADTKANQ